VKGTPTLKLKKCGFCKEPFMPARPLQKCCSPQCAGDLIEAKKAKAEAKRAKKERADDRVKREKLKTRSDYMKEAQREFNRYVRLRDAGRPCICCGDSLAEDRPGGAADAGHYRSVGSAPHLRFHEDNCHAQSKRCNRYGGGRAVDYRRGLIARIGLARVEALEADQTPRHYSVDDLKAIRDTYRRKARDLERA
jgi:hypothetical protein